MSKCTFCFGKKRIFNTTTQQTEDYSGCGGTGKQGNMEESFNNFFQQVWGASHEEVQKTSEELQKAGVEGENHAIAIFSIFSRKKKGGLLIFEQIARPYLIHKVGVFFIKKEFSDTIKKHLIYIYFYLG